MSDHFTKLSFLRSIQCFRRHSETLKRPHTNALCDVLRVLAPLDTDTGLAHIWSDLDSVSRASLASTCSAIAWAAEVTRHRWPISQISDRELRSDEGTSGVQSGSISHLTLHGDAGSVGPLYPGSLSDLYLAFCGSRGIYAPELHVDVKCQDSQLVELMKDLKAVGRRMASVTYATDDPINTVALLNAERQRRSWSSVVEAEYLVLRVTDLGSLTTTAAGPHECKVYVDRLPTVVLVDDLSRSNEGQETSSPSKQRSIAAALGLERKAQLKERARAIARLACETGCGRLIIAASSAGDKGSATRSACTASKDLDKLEKYTRKFRSEHDPVWMAVCSRSDLVVVPPNERATLLHRIGMGVRTEDVCEELVRQT